MRRMCKLKISVIEKSFRTSCITRTKKSMLWIPFAQLLIQMRNGNACLLSTSSNLLKLHYSSAKVNMIHGVFQTSLESNVLKTWHLLLAQITKPKLFPSTDKILWQSFRQPLIITQVGVLGHHLASITAMLKDQLIVVQVMKYQLYHGTH